MNPIKRFLTRLRFRRSIKTDESSNVVDSMVKARQLYKELVIAIHPDKHIDQQDVAEDLMKRVVANKHNYHALISLKKEMEEKLK